MRLTVLALAAVLAFGATAPALRVGDAFASKIHRRGHRVLHCVGETG